MEVFELAILDLLALDVLSEPLDLLIHIPHILSVKAANVFEHSLHPHVLIHLTDAVAIHLGEVRSVFYTVYSRQLLTEGGILSTH